MKEKHSSLLKEIPKEHVFPDNSAIPKETCFEFYASNTFAKQPL
jgi:hypothetical protein